jgi:predicted DNA-binding transcriptional regulator AlpA
MRPGLFSTKGDFSDMEPQTRSITPQVPQKLFNCNDCARYFGVSITTFWRMTHKDDFPKPYRMNGRNRRWRLEELEAFLESTRAKS